jgi:transposase
MRERQKQNQYTDDFKADALRLLESTDAPLTVVAARLGLNHWTLRGWYRAAVAKNKAKRPLPAKKGATAAIPAEETAAERLARLEQENARLRKRVEDLGTDRAILKKAAAFFARESE